MGYVINYDWRVNDFLPEVCRNIICEAENFTSLYSKDHGKKYDKKYSITLQ